MKTAILLFVLLFFVADAFATDMQGPKVCDSLLDFAAVVQRGKAVGVTQQEVLMDIHEIISDPLWKQLLMNVTHGIYRGVPPTDMYRLCMSLVRAKRKWS